FVLVGIAVLSRRRASHVPVLLAGILPLAQMPFLQGRTLSLERIHHRFPAASGHFSFQVRQILLRKRPSITKGSAANAPTSTHSASRQFTYLRIHLSTFELPAGAAAFHQ